MKVAKIKGKAKYFKLFFTLVVTILTYNSALLAQVAQDSKVANATKTIKIGSENAYKPFAYVDSKNEVHGFDNDVVKIVANYLVADENDPKARYKISFMSVPWNVLFMGLDSKKYDLVANQIAKTQERKQKYIFSEKPYFYGVSALILSPKSGAKNIKSLKDFGGSDKIGVTVGSNHAANLEKYAKDNNATFKIMYYKTSPALIADLANGRIVGMINDPIAATDYAKSQNVKIKVTDFILEKTPVYFVFRQDSERLAQEFDVALQKAISEGKIENLIRKYFGDSYLEMIKDGLSKND